MRNSLISLIIFVILGSLSCKNEKESSPQIDSAPHEIILNQPGTMDGYDSDSGTIIDPINVWSDYENRVFGGKLHHGEKVTLIKRIGDGVLVKNATGTKGWVTYFFIKELQ